jgi:hypothetical protein
MFNLEKLDVWNEAIAFANLIYSGSRRFPDEERFGRKCDVRRFRFHRIWPKVAQEFRVRISLDLWRLRLVAL